MFKSIFKLLVFGLFVFLLAGKVNAASDLSIRMEQPKSPTNQDTFDITFVTLDIQGRAITVKCFKKGPSDGAFIQFGSDINIGSGGNTGKCAVNSSIINTSGTYQFNVQAQAGGDLTTSSTYGVDFNTGGPGTPTNFGKERLNPCEYKISYRSANDSGKTVKVELYRSDSQSFTADSGTRVNSHAIGSDTADSFNDFIPDCSKNYFYVVRAFDSFGNGSGLEGDSSITVVEGSTTISETKTGGGSQSNVGAIPVGEGEVLAEKSDGKVDSKEELKKDGEVKGDEAEEKEKEVNKAGLFNGRNILLGFVILFVLGIPFFFYKRLKSR